MKVYNYRRHPQSAYNEKNTRGIICLLDDICHFGNFNTRSRQRSNGLLHITRLLHCPSRAGFHSIQYGVPRIPHAAGLSNAAAPCRRQVSLVTARCWNRSDAASSPAPRYAAWYRYSEPCTCDRQATGCQNVYPRKLYTAGGCSNLYNVHILYPLLQFSRQSAGLLSRPRVQFDPGWCAPCVPDCGAR